MAGFVHKREIVTPDICVFASQTLVNENRPAVQGRIYRVLNIIKHLNLNRKHTSQAQHMPKPR